jgi:ATP-dependent RNA helicase DDX31/DBP7
VLVRAETGSGKTLSYIAPLFSEIGSITPRVTRQEGTRGLVLVPTRELATQVEDTAKKVGRPFHWVVTSSIMGGENRAKEKARLRKGVCLLIATPGRLLDHLRMTESFMIDNLRWLVLDEADRLLDLGFEEDLNAILAEIGKRTEGASLCTALLSATLTPGTARLAGAHG